MCVGDRTAWEEVNISIFDSAISTLDLQSPLFSSRLLT
jgi:hypothetical protein